ncbi:MAG: hypothetical protein QOG34_2401 [Frankiaceae bacterium]|nr:hypothetical protein [Frankiaceae bacterium]
MIVRRKKHSYLLLVLPILGSGALLLGPLAGAGAAAPAKDSPPAHSQAATHGASDAHSASGAHHASGEHAAAASGHSSGTAGTSGDSTEPQPVSNADQNAGGANGACPSGPYCSTRDGSASGNGNGNGAAVGKPCAGCVGKADNKNPPGQYPDGSDPNAGYECDRNHGIGQTNPAHTGCTTPTIGGSDCTTNPTGPECGTKCVPTAANHFCSSVLGTKTVRKPTTTTKVLGLRVVRTTSSLPFTGAFVVPMIAAGGVLLTAGAGFLVLAANRRRRTTA